MRGAATTRKKLLLVALLAVLLVGCQKPSIKSLGLTPRASGLDVRVVVENPDDPGDAPTVVFVVPGELTPFVEDLAVKRKLDTLPKGISKLGSTDLAHPGIMSEDSASSNTFNASLRFNPDYVSQVSLVSQIRVVATIYDTAGKEVDRREAKIVQESLAAFPGRATPEPLQVTKEPVSPSLEPSVSPATSVAPTAKPRPPGGGRGQIAFVSDRDGNYEIYVMSADGAGQTRLTDNQADDREQAWSPDGQRIAFRSFGNNEEIYLMNVDGSGQTQLTDNRMADDLGPAWSPDGQRIAFWSDRDGQNEIYVMNADGSGQTRVTHNQPGDGLPTWDPWIGRRDSP